jgi:dephospho-CoA kinase
MTVVLVTGMSGTGKSSAVRELARRGYRAVDLDQDEERWHRWARRRGQVERLWREDAITRLLTQHHEGALYVAGTAANQGRFYTGFDHVVLLSAPAEVVLERLARRTDNPYGKSEEERARVRADLAEAEPLIRRTATEEIDTTAPLEQVVDRLVALATQARPEV